MKIVVQRVSRASVRVADRDVGAIRAGLLALVGFRDGDDEVALEWMKRKLLGLRVFPDDDGVMNRNVQEVGGSLLLVSQFTLYGDVKRGNRPSYIEAAAPATAEALYDRFVAIMRDSDLVVETGEFGAMMDVELVNDGPVTIILEK